MRKLKRYQRTTIKAGTASYKTKRRKKWAGDAPLQGAPDGSRSPVVSTSRGVSSLVDVLVGRNRRGCIGQQGTRAQVTHQYTERSLTSVLGGSGSVLGGGGVDRDSGIGGQRGIDSGGGVNNSRGLDDGGDRSGSLGSSRAHSRGRLRGTTGTSLSTMTPSAHTHQIILTM